MTTCRTTMQASRQTKTDEPRSSPALSTRRHFFTSIVGRHKRRTQLITWRHKDHTRLITGDSLTAATGPGLDTTWQAGALIRGKIEVQWQAVWQICIELRPTLRARCQATLTFRWRVLITINAMARLRTACYMRSPDCIPPSPNCWRSIFSYGWLHVSFIVV